MICLSVCGSKAEDDLPCHLNNNERVGVSGSMRYLLRSILALCLTAALPVAAASQPNIVLVLLDNTGWGDFGPYGGGSLRGAPSPSINRLAEQGLTLTNFNTEPQCTPSRSALMTGRFAIRSGTHQVPIGVPYYGLVPWEETLAERLKTAGYQTAIFGKWHLGKTAGRLPTDQGFDFWYGIPDSSGDAVRWSDWPKQYSIASDLKDGLPEREYPWVWQAKTGAAAERVKPFDLEGKREIDGELTRLASDYITQQSKTDQPFFAYIPLTAMHFPTLPSEAFAGKSGHGIYADMLIQTDHYIGLIDQAIQSSGQSGNTIFIVAADNGPEDPENGDGQYTGWTGPWRGTYFTALEGGLRAPFLIRWPGVTNPGARSNGMVHLVDIFSTLTEAGGADVPNDRIIDGVSMRNLFSGATVTSPREGFPIFVGAELYAVKWRDWKAHFIEQDSKYSPKREYSTVAKVVNLVQDPREERQAVEPVNAWIQYPGMGVMLGYHKSLALQANIPLGAPDNYVPAPLGSLEARKPPQ
jgi:arylsulfatase A-like enzyme